MADGNKDKGVDPSTLFEEEPVATVEVDPSTLFIDEPEPKETTTTGDESFQEPEEKFPSTERPIDFSRGLGYNFGDDLEIPEDVKAKARDRQNKIISSLQEEQAKTAKAKAEKEASIGFRLSRFDPEEFADLTSRLGVAEAAVDFAEALGQEPTPEEVERLERLTEEHEKQSDTNAEFEKIQFYDLAKEKLPDATTVTIYEQWLSDTNPDVFIALESQKEQGKFSQRDNARHTERAIQFKSEIFKNRFSSLENSLGEEFFRKKVELEEQFRAADSEDTMRRIQEEYNELLSNETFGELVELGKDLEALQTEAEDYIKEFPEYQKELIDNQTKQLMTDENYKNQNWVVQRMFEIDDAIQKVLSKAVKDVLTLPRTLSLDNEFGWTDSWAKSVEEVVDQWMAGTTPSKISRNLIEDIAKIDGNQLVIKNGEIQSIRDPEGYVIQDEQVKADLTKQYNANKEDFPVETQTNYDIAFPKFLQMTGDMALLLVGAGKGTAILKGLGVSQKTSQAVALSGAVTTQVHNEAYNAAIRNNLSPAEASKYAWAISGSVALVNQINPQYFIFAKAGLINDVTRQTMKSIISGTSKRDAYIKAGSFIVKQGLRESAEETAEIPAETMVRALANNMTNGRATFDLSQDFNHYTESAVLGFVGGATFSPLGIRSRSRMNSEALRAAVFNPEGFRSALRNQIGNEYVINGKKTTLTPEIIQQFQSDFNQIVERVQEINEVKPLNIEEQIVVSELSRRKLALERQNGLESTQDIVRDRNTDEIDVINTKLNAIMNLSELDSYYEVDGDVLTKSEFFKRIQEPEFISRIRQGDIEFRIKNDTEAADKLNDMIREEIKRTDITTEGGKFTMRKTDEGLELTNNETGKTTTRKDEKFNEVLDEFKAENLGQFRTGKTVGDTAPIELNEEEVDRLVLDESENPQEVAAAYLKELHASEGSQEGGVEDIIASYLTGFPFNSIREFSDPNLLSGRERMITLNYVRKTGEPIDTQLQTLSEAAGFEITGQEVIDFIFKYPNGRHSFSDRTQRLTDLEAKFEVLTGFPIDEKYAADLVGKSEQDMDAMTDEMMDIIEKEGITEDNIDNLQEGLFNGFPYTQEEFNLIKSFLKDEPISIKPEKVEKPVEGRPAEEPSPAEEEARPVEEEQPPPEEVEVEPEVEEIEEIPAEPEPEPEEEVPVEEEPVAEAEEVPVEEIIAEEIPEEAEEIEVPAAEVTTIGEPEALETQILADIASIEKGTTTPQKSGIGKKFAQLKKVDEEKHAELFAQFRPVFSAFKVKQAKLAEEGEKAIKREGIAAATTKKQFATVVGSAPAKTTRIQPNPIVGQVPKQLNEIQLDLSKALGRKIITTKRPSARHSLGSFNPASAAIKIKFAGDLDTTAHEIGHSLDDQFGLLAGIPTNQLAEFDKELSKFWGSGSTPPGNLSAEAKTAYRRGEGIAEWIRALVVNPAEAQKAAPRFNAWYESTVPEATRQAVLDFSNDVRVFSGATAHDQIMSNVEWDPKRGETLIGSLFTQGRTTSGEWQLTFADRMAQKMTNQFRPFEKAFEFAMGERGITEVLPENDIRITARNHLGINEKIDDVFENGVVDAQNKRVKDTKTKQAMNISWLIEPLNNDDTKTLDEEMKETVSFMIGERTVELPNKFAKEQIELDLKDDILPPDEVLDRYPEILERKIKIGKKQVKIGDKIKSLKASEVKPREEARYDFTSNVLTGIGGGLFKDIEVAQKRLAEFNELADTDKPKHTRIIEAARRYRVMSDAILQYMADKGRISQEQLRRIRETNTQYVALQRIIQIEPGSEVEVFSKGKGGRIGTVAEPIKKIKGSSAIIQKPYASLLDFVYRGMKEADRNEVMVNFRDILTTDRGMAEGDPQNLAQIGRKATAEDRNTIRIFVNGEVEHWQFDEDVFMALTGINDTGYRFPAFITALPRILRWSVTNFPIFGVRNWIRDTQNRIIITRADSGFKEFVGTQDDIDRFRLFGGGQAGYYIKDRYSYYQKLGSAMKDLAKNKRFILLDPARLKEKAWDKGYRRFIEGTETANRVAEFRAAFKKAKEAGLDDYNANLQAAYEARDLLDFAVAGEWMRVVNQVVPFSNAAVQGLKRSIIAAKENPKGFLLRWGLYAVAPAVLQRIMIGFMGEDREKEYQQMPSFQRDLFYNFPLTDNTWISIPKPFELGVMASGVERLVDLLFYENKGAFDGYAGSVARSTLPVDESALAGPGRAIFESMANYDFFRQKHIIPPREKQLKISKRNTDRASRIGRMIQEISGIASGEPQLDARLIDQFIKGQFTYFGNFALKLSDIGREKGEGFDFHLGDLGIFKQTPVWNSKDVQWVIKKGKEEGMLRDPDYAELNYLIQEFFNAPNDKEKTERGKVVREYSSKLRKFWEKQLETKENLKE